ncbi:MAG: hypothetical protein ABSG57_08335 [Candidatus Bathyarchaeia archaeon]|jgi:hypothetical protein
MEVEQAVLDYLSEFGNTRESDLLKYIQKHFKRAYSESGSKKVLDRLTEEGKVFRVVHTKLRPPGVYFSLKEQISPELLKALLKFSAEHEKNLFQLIGTLELSRSANAEKMLEEARKLLQDKQ